MSGDLGPGRSHDDEMVEGQTGEIRYEARYLRETDAEENLIQECNIDWKSVRADSSRLEVRPEHDLPTNDGP